MLSITDEQGRRWEVVVGKESFGAMVFLFSSSDSDKVLRHSIAAGSRLEAERWLRQMSVDELRTMLNEATPWSPSNGGEDAT